MRIESKEGLLGLFEGQEATRWSLAATGPNVRIEKLRALRKSILSRQVELADCLRADFSKPEAEVWMTEILPSVEEIDFAIRHLRGWMRDVPIRGETTLPLSRGRIHYEPKGRVLIMAPWNYPFQLLIAPLVSAIAAGNCVMAKPSNKTPHTAAFIADLLGSLFPPTEIVVVEGAGAVIGDSLLELPFDHIFFTGSPKVGIRVGEAAARIHAGLSLELGGKSPAILLDGADIEETARRLMWGKCLNAGQTCIAPDYLLCPASRVADFAAAARSAVERCYGRDEAERQASPDFARIVDQAACLKLAGQVSDAIAKGATLAFGGVFEPKTRYASPTLLTGVLPTMSIMDEEIFGPVLPVLAYDDLDEAIDFIRARPKPLALYAFGRSPKGIGRVLADTTSGSVCVNNLLIQVENRNLPFGGVGMSGTGSYHGFFGFKTFSHERNILRQGPIDLTRRLYPPYGRASNERSRRAIVSLLGMRLR